MAAWRVIHLQPSHPLSKETSNETIVPGNGSLLDTSYYMQEAVLQLLGSIVGYFVIVTLTLKLWGLIGRGGKRRRLSRLMRNESIRLKLIRWLHRTRSLDTIDFGQTGLSGLLCLFYVIETYGHSNKVFEIITIAINIFFILDYFLRLYISQDQLAYVYSFFAVVDALTIIPLVFSWINSSHNDTLVVLRLVRLSKLFRVLRSFRVLKSAPGDGFKREVTLLVFTTATVIFTAAGFYQVIESPGGLDLPEGQAMAIKFHEALYLATCEVLGRPKLPVDTTVGYILLFLVVVSSIIIIPRQLAKLWQVMQRDPLVSRDKYHKQNEFHIVLMGHVDFPSLNMFLYEAYHPDRGTCTPFDVVVLSRAMPDMDTQSLLMHPCYVGFVQYLVGSPQVDRDLARARVQDADAVFILNNKSLADPLWEDQQVAAACLACKAFKNAALHSTEHMEQKKLRVLAQVRTKETRDRIHLMPGWDIRRDVCIVTEELSAAMLALAGLHRGLATLVVNLVSHTSLGRDGDTEEWFQQYQHGLQNEVYYCSVPSDSSLIGRTILQTAQVIMESHGILLLGVRKSKASARLSKAGSSKEKTKRSLLRLFPGTDDDVILCGDHLFAIAKSLSHLAEAVKEQFAPSGMRTESDESTQSMLVQDKNTGLLSVQMSVGAQEPDGSLGEARGHTQNSRRIGSLTSFDTRGVTEKMRQMKQTGEAAAQVLKTRALERALTAANVARSFKAKSNTFSVELRARARGNLESLFHTHYSGNVNALLNDLRTFSSDNEYVSEPHFVQQPLIVPFHDHILIIGGTGPSIALVVRMLQMRANKVQIVILNPNCTQIQAERCCHDIADLEQVHFVDGSVECHSDLDAVNLRGVRSVIVLPTSSGPSGHNALEMPLREHMRIIDSDTILTTNIIATRPLPTMEVDEEEPHYQHQLVPERGDVWTVTQLVQDGSLGRFFGMAPEAQGGTSRFDDRWRNSPPVNIAPLYAAGHIISATLLDRFLVESYFNPYTLLLVERLFGLSGLFVDPRWEQTYCEDVSDARPRAFTVSISQSIVDHYVTYGALAETLLGSDRPVLPLGLFRHPGGQYSSYSYLVSLEAANLLDFRSTAAEPKVSSSYVDGSGTLLFHDSLMEDAPGDEPSSPRHKHGLNSEKTQRLPFVITNPPKETRLMATDLVFVLGNVADDACAGNGPDISTSPSESFEAPKSPRSLLSVRKGALELPPEEEADGRAREPRTRTL